MPRFEIRANGPTRAELRIYGDIGQSWDAEESNDAKTVVEALGKLRGDLDVRINSFGGSVADGIAIYNALRRHNGAVATHIDGVAYSIASLIAMAGRSVNIAENGMLMIHAPWGAAIGNAVEMREMADILDKHAEAMLTSYLRDGGPNADTVRGWLTDGQDHYFTAAEAVELGLADAISDQAQTVQIAAALRQDARRFHLPAAMSRLPEDSSMSDSASQGGSLGTPDPTDALSAHSKTVQAAVDKGIKAEAARRAAVAGVFAGFYTADPLDPVSALHDECMDDVKCDELSARRRLMAMLAAKSADPVIAPVQYGAEHGYTPPPRASAHLGGAMLAGRDVADKRAQGIEAALRIKAGIEKDRAKIEAERRGEFLSLSLVDIMAQELRGRGMGAHGSREDIARRYVNALPIMAGGPSHTTDHLPAVLGNIANLSAMEGWNAANESWQVWTQSGTLTNYQTHTRANVALLDKLTKMLEGQQWEYGDMADVKQRITGYFYGLKYGLSLQSIVNDDLGELARQMQAWGEAANATVGDVVYATILTAGSGGYGQTMDEDSTLLFHANHSNYIASGAGAAPSETTLNTARAAMIAKNDPNGRKVAAVPRYLIHGPSLYATVMKVLNSQDLQSVTVDGSTGATVLSGSINTARSMNLAPVEEYRIVATAPAATAWLLAAARRTVEVAGVGGPVMPRVEQSAVSNIPGIEYQMWCPFGVAALDYRGLYLNYGA
ncbi:MAG: Clp protease ClpP [Gammaproteobacteria bacterium]|jgi:ATP-dependent protease ClpP protease subunit|nr:Clp protease ClpP [Gammaproteobacteria bacterium]